MATHIDVHNAAVHNLQHVNVRIPRNQLVVFTGVSGSGKSSLAFDTIFAESQRRFVESLSNYAKQFIGAMERPKVESITGLSPAIAIEQKSSNTNPRSTVGTLTEVVDYLRVLYARVGLPHCPKCQVPIAAQTINRMMNVVNDGPAESRLQVLSPVVRGRKGDYNALFQQLRKEGVSRVRIDGELRMMDDLPNDFRLPRTKVHHIQAVIDRIVLKPDDATQARLLNALELAMRKSGGYAVVDNLTTEAEHWFSRHLACPQCDTSYDELAPRTFSFNSPYGACAHCSGLGSLRVLDVPRLIPDMTKTLADGAIPALVKYTGSYYDRFIQKLGKTHDIPITIPYQDLTAPQRDVLLYGAKTPPKVKPKRQKGDEVPLDDLDWFGLIADYPGIVAIMQKYAEVGTDRDKAYVASLSLDEPCADCDGARLKPFSLSVTLPGFLQDMAQYDTVTYSAAYPETVNIHQVCQLPIPAAMTWVQGLLEQLPEDNQRLIARPLVHEVEQRLRFLRNVGLDYLTLARGANTLSGGEAQRIRLASQLGSDMSGVMYVLDEPSIGLHPHNNAQLISSLQRLRDQGNSVLVVEHDEELIRASDWVVDVGPAAGRHGGHILAEGPVSVIQQQADSLTGLYLSGKQTLMPQTARRPVDPARQLTIANGTLHNLKQLTVSIPLGQLVVITGLSGSGKSTLVFDLLYPALRHALDTDLPKPAGYGQLDGAEHLDKLVFIDQAPIGKTSRSNPATYLGVLDPIRQVFASGESAKMAGLGAGHFSFNTKAGRCPACNGLGEQTLEMNFLPNVRITCEVCDGARYRPEVLQCTWQDKTIANVLAMTVEEARRFFVRQARIANLLGVLEDVGLGYITLGQSATTLSGGEAQRLKLASELCRRSTGKTLYLLDEPSIGLHWHDLGKLLEILQRLVDLGNSVLIIEHNMDVIAAADTIIDLGPGSGHEGGSLVVQGTPEAVAAHPLSLTGQYLAEHLARQQAMKAS
jgi:excinuclease ABC subunit A